jgi:hypothetical protein
MVDTGYRETAHDLAGRPGTWRRSEPEHSDLVAFFRPALPAGLAFDATAGHITGTPSELQAATRYTVTAANACGSTAATLSITINDKAPAALSYATSAAVYTIDAAILVNVPTVTAR